MSAPGLFQTLEGVPGHGFGPLGRLARAVLIEHLHAPPAEPRLHLGHNTLPDPRSPVSGQLAYPVVEGAWERCGQDLFAFLDSAVASLRAQPRVPASAYGEQHRMLNRLLRVDSIALAWEVRTILPTESVAGWTLAADAMAGRVRRKELDEAAGVAEPTVAVWAVDRAGVALLMHAPVGGSGEDIGCADTLLDGTDPVVARLAGVLDAQYEWTTAVFGAGG